MTPLAHRIVKELTLPKTERKFDDVGGVLPLMSDTHCFELSDAMGIIDDFRSKSYACGIDSDLVFLPAPKTWVEFKYQIGKHQFRVGYHLSVSGEHCFARECKMGYDQYQDTWNSGRVFRFRLSGEAPAAGRHDANERWLREHDQEIGDGMTICRFLRIALAVINTPRIIGRRQHMPHRGLEKRLTAALKPQGKFPLHAWTEILLHVTPPQDLSHEPSTEAHLTGERALHFCRAHLRIRLGRLEMVRAHWRGDASLGIKRSRYKVAA